MWPGAGTQPPQCSTQRLLPDLPTDSRSCHEHRGRSLESCFLATSHSSPRACGGAAGGGKVRPGDGRGDRRGGAPRPLHHRRRGGGAEAAGPPLASQENTPHRATADVVCRRNAMQASRPAGGLGCEGVCFGFLKSAVSCVRAWLALASRRGRVQWR